MNELAALPTAVATRLRPRLSLPARRLAASDARTCAGGGDNALKIRRRELGAREEQTGTIPLATITGQTPDQISSGPGEAVPAGAAAQTQVGLLDADGNGKIDGFVDVPAPAFTAWSVSEPMGP